MAKSSCGNSKSGSKSGMTKKSGSTKKPKM